MKSEGELTQQEIVERMSRQMVINARLKPWGWEFKYIAARQLLEAGRPIKFVKDTLNVTYRWLERHQLIHKKSYGVMNWRWERV